MPMPLHLTTYMKQDASKVQRTATAEARSKTDHIILTAYTQDNLSSSTTSEENTHFRAGTLLGGTPGA